ncbi:hypothetical protein COR50_18015 [Chitinophaga caeni]|uniref:Uncharacterized protein n=1 Tax=Chitinophaga caeni TaxID=2029983 RepID=A0A291QY96_9BACT|nr:polysaccharide lyase family 8 super-sandwich domain-containing protein [Chitinophaga caeni]ATL48910.1 hypothetical protein COR50_18015 [Chitinophaga caeni]
MKYVITFTALIMIIPLIATAQPIIKKRSTAAEFSIIHQQIVDQLPIEEGGIQNIDRTASYALSQMTPGGAFKNIDYNNKRRANWPVTDHLKYLQALSLAYTLPASKYYRQTGLEAKIIASLKDWNDKNPICPNWFPNEIRGPQLMGQILLILKLHDIKVPADIQSGLIEKMQRGDMYKQTGANKLDVALHYIYEAVITRNEELMNKAAQQCYEPIEFTREEGLQYDYTFFQHGPQLQIAAYGMTFIRGEYRAAAFLNNTRWAIPAEKKEMLSRYFKQVYLNTTRGPYNDFNTTGREFSRIGSLKKGLSTIGYIIRDAALVSLEDSSFYELVKQKLQGSKAPSFKTPTMHRHFWIGDYTLYHCPAYLFSVRTNSVRTGRTEIINSENLLGRTNSDGATNIQRRGDEYYNIFPLWEWDKIPGVTCRDYVADTISKARIGGLGTTAFVGGLSDSLYGHSVYTQNFDDVRAQKAYFFVKDAVVCLGTGISSNSYEPITTTLNQCWLNSPVYVNGKKINGKKFDYNFNGSRSNWIWQDSIAYIFPRGGQVKGSQQREYGNWGRLNVMYTDKNKASGEVFKLWLEHGIKPMDGNYAYIIKPGIGLDMLDPVAVNDIQILANNDTLQAISQKKEHIYQAICYKAQQFRLGNYKLAVDQACLLMIRKNVNGKTLLSLADPTQQLESINITINHQKIHCQLPNGVNAGRTQEYVLNNINMNFENFLSTATAPIQDLGDGITRQILGHDASMMMVKVNFEKGAVGAMHQHVHTQSTYVLDGVFEFTVGNETKLVKKGDALIMPSNVMHGCKCLEAGSLLDVFTPRREDYLITD